MAKQKFRFYRPGHTDPFRISRSKVDLYLNCPCCFYLDQRMGLKRPPGFPFNLNSAVDALLKTEFDGYRAEHIAHPYMKEAGLHAVPYDHPDLHIWRNNFKGVSYVHPGTLFEAFGAVDDLWLDLDTGEVIVVDYKSTSKSEAVSLDADWQIGYKRQMEFYQWLLRQNGLKVANRGWFVYCNGMKDKRTFSNRLDFIVSLLPYDGNDSWVEPTLNEIKVCLEADSIPEPAADCDYCNYAKAYANPHGLHIFL
jgi:CRISPR/Cas system-associated exonuclease Cas4 (RecB family)